jgi:secondary thiamine-phosphate synthase enzyme
MRQSSRVIEVHTRGKGLYDISDEVRGSAQQSELSHGLCTVYVAHTSASLVIQENADPEVQHDLERFFARLVPDGDPLFRHVEEGPDDMPAHVRAALTQTSLGIPLLSGRLALGTWQGVYVFEHRARGGTRHLVLHVLGTP